MNVPPGLKKWCRPVAAGEGIWHYGDCRIHGLGICTCGLLSELNCHRFDYPKLMDRFKDDFEKHEHALNMLSVLNEFFDIRVAIREKGRIKLEKMAKKKKRVRK